MHVCLRRVNAFLITKLAAINRTPFNQFIVICVTLTKPLPVCLFFAGREYVQKDAVANFDVTASLHAACINSLTALVDFLLQILCPATFAEGVPTLFQCKLILWRQHIVANQAKTVLVELHKA